jgi:hypothetical protein
MILTRNKLYSFLLAACLAGYIWLYFSITSIGLKFDSLEVCLIKNVTNIPCPSCGTTRSIILLMKGNFVEAFHLNPIGYIVSSIMLITPFWIIWDSFSKNNSLFRFYKKTEFQLNKPRYAIPLILLVLINWIWNIMKGL